MTKRARLLSRSSALPTRGQTGVLAAIKVIFDQTPHDAIGSQILVDALAADSASEWAEWKGGKPITQRHLSVLLKPFRIFPDRVQIGTQQVRGYKRAWFTDAWDRYLPVFPSDSPVKASED